MASVIATPPRAPTALELAAAVVSLAWPSHFWTGASGEVIRTPFAGTLSSPAARIPPCVSFLRAKGVAERGALSRFVEEAVQAHILEVAAEQAKAQNAELSQAEISDAIDAGLEWARRA